MKRFVSVILTVALLLSVIPWGSICISVSAATSDFAGGTGTESDPYRIQTKEHLNNVRNYLSAHFKMVADIEFTDGDYSRDGKFYGYGQGFIPIAYGSAFTGTFDGDGHVIRNLQMTPTSDKATGLFCGNQGTIKNVGIVYSSLSAIGIVGSIAGTNYDTIENCYHKSSVSAGPGSSSSYYPDGWAGGIVGYNYKGTVKSCYNTGSVKATGASASIYDNADAYAGKSSDALVTKTDKGTQSKPSAPMLSGKTHNSVTLFERGGYEYSRDGIHWQASAVFTGLDAETSYLFYQRKAETETHYASESSAALIVKTDETPPVIRGDMNSDNEVTDADALYLLRYTLFPERYPLKG